MNGFILPEEIYYHQGHSWAVPEGKNVVKVGIDDFAQKLVGKIDAIQLPGRFTGDSGRKGMELSR